MDVIKVTSVNTVHARLNSERLCISLSFSLLLEHPCSFRRLRASYEDRAYIGIYSRQALSWPVANLQLGGRDRRKLCSGLETQES